MMFWILCVVVSFSLALYTVKKLEGEVPLWAALVAGFLCLIPLLNIGVIVVSLFALGHNSKRLEVFLNKKIL